MPARFNLPRVCVALGFKEPAQVLEHARREITAGESFLEIRADYLASPETAIAVIESLTMDHPDCVLLATCRRQQNHGHYSGSIEEQLRFLSAAADAGARVVDLEIESAEQVKSQLPVLRSKCLLVVSWHNFQTTPAMASVLRRMSRVEADIWKIVTTARKPSDMLRVLACGKTLPAKSVLQVMGEVGIASRVLAHSFGSVYTYAAPACADGTAPGQISAHQLRHLYRIDRLSKTAKVYGVIADPVKHSLSPAIHNRALQSKRADAVYLPFLVQPAYLRDFMMMAEHLPIAGFSVTIPHKQKIVRFVDHIDPLARRIGAVNTVWRKAGRWRGTNTDVAGVLEPLSRRLKLPKASVLLVGTGGAARGAAFALADAGAQVSITGRTPEKIRSLAKLTGARALTPADLKDSHFDVLVHATPLGMYPASNECFFEESIPADVVFDMVYNPLETELLRRAREQGRQIIQGVEMFVAQAALQFELWTGETAPRSVMEKAVLEALAPSH